MKAVIISCILALAFARPQHSKSSVARILRDDRVEPLDGAYSFNIETEDGIVRSESGSVLNHLDEKPVGQQGTISYPLPNGEIFTLKFVANENGYQPESPFLPVAPAFPHPIPQFVLDQIEFARRQDEEEARKG